MSRLSSVIVVWTAVAWSLAASEWTFSHPMLASRQSGTHAPLEEDVGSDVITSLIIDNNSFETLDKFCRANFVMWLDHVHEGIGYT